jgi:hypothetical protein
MADGTDEELVKMFRKTLGNPKTRDRQLKLVKEVEPNLPIPEVDAEARVMERVAPLEKELAALKAQNEKDAILAGINKQRESVKREFGLDDAGIEKVEKIMIEKKIGDHKTAAEVMQMNSRVATPTVDGSSYVQLKMPTEKALLENPTEWARNEAHAAVDELRGRR